ncbi:cytochrome P450 4V3 [Thozetella sp. PMI_491]|nr:cytochrome P450 4V3 [Thozetella sp. PMI_491]
MEELAWVIRYTGIAVLMAVLGYYLYRGYKVRMMFRKLKTQGVPLMKHSILFGHLVLFQKLCRGYPRDMHPLFIPCIILDHWRVLFPDQTSCPPVLYLDLWPIGPPMLFVLNLDLSVRFASDMRILKAAQANDFLQPLGHGLDIVTNSGAIWKTWRSRLNPGFSAKNIQALVPLILDEVTVFAEVLRSKAGRNGEWGEVFPLEELANNLTFDVITRATIGIRLHEQTNGPTPFKAALLDQLNLCMFDRNIFTAWSWINPMRQISIWRNNKIMKDFIMQHIRARIDGSAGPEAQDQGATTVIDLALKSVWQESQLSKTPDVSLDPEIIDTVISNVKIFLFAGHDTTATAICWVLHSLAKNPAAMAKLRAEHDEVLGQDLQAIAQRLREEPRLLNSLVYTSACVKEALRLHPGPPIIRTGAPELVFEVPGSPIRYPTDGFMMWDALKAYMRWNEAWPRPTEFLPERWTTGSPDHIRPPKNAWRVFGVGPRNCIGQELAMVEIKMVLALIARGLDLDCSWEDWARVNGKPPARVMVDGDYCYQCGAGMPHTSEGMPVHVRLAGVRD